MLSVQTRVKDLFTLSKTWPKAKAQSNNPKAQIPNEHPRPKYGLIFQIGPKPFMGLNPRPKNIPSPKHLNFDGPTRTKAAKV